MFTLQSLKTADSKQLPRNNFLYLHNTKIYQLGRNMYNKFRMPTSVVQVFHYKINQSQHQRQSNNLSVHYNIPVDLLAHFHIISAISDVYRKQN